MPGDDNAVTGERTTRSDAVFAEIVATATASVYDRIAAAAARAGRNPSDITLVAVTKFNPPEAVQAAYAAGVRVFGENRVQEAESKIIEIADTVPGAEFHMLGHLQSNKVKKALPLFSCIQSIDSTALLVELEKRAASVNRYIDVLLELHTGEESKSGFPDPETLTGAMEEARNFGYVRLRGLMTMAPYTDDVGVVRGAFRSCARLYDTIRERYALPHFDTLSMGMTNDFEIAIEEGATMVRIGTAIFGQRVYR